ncbi:hypothetical protein F4778DRAFT_346618 [Xylariomycetidae sp. FL2044]|nr:hypothetical protein F4778DRAFT_346618 [Xylariomycetidae sp. FL2044]
MAHYSSLSQISFACTVLASALGSCMAITPPNQARNSPSLSTGDTLRHLNLTGGLIILLPRVYVAMLSLHTAGLALALALSSSQDPNPQDSFPDMLLGHGAQNGLNPELLTWSAATAIPLILILLAGVPLRLGSYASLGRNFTFELAQPDRLTTTGIYAHVQHPSYTGLIAVIVGNYLLLGRSDGAVSCWIPPAWFGFLNIAGMLLAPLWVAGMMWAFWLRVRQEEGMLRGQFGPEWERWHKKTWRFVPWVF